jgi:hypothetical protein
MAALTGAFAQTGGSTTYTANLAPVPLNGADGASGTFKLVLNGNEATITEQVSGLAATLMNAPFPHVQHIHGGAMGMCPTAARDTNKDGVLSTVEGGPDYGDIQTTLSLSGDTSPAAGTNIQVAPSGASFNYSRTITLDDATMASLKAGKAVVVVHGLDPAKAAPAATSSPSELVPSLPLAATSPALCGVVKAEAMATATPMASASATPMANATSTPMANATATMVPPKTGNGGLADGSDATTPVVLGLIGLGVVLGAGAIVRRRLGQKS